MKRITPVVAAVFRVAASSLGAVPAEAKNTTDLTTPDKVIVGRSSP